MCGGTYVSDDAHYSAQGQLSSRFRGSVTRLVYQLACLLYLDKISPGLYISLQRLTRSIMNLNLGRDGHID